MPAQKRSNDSENEEDDVVDLQRNNHNVSEESEDENDDVQQEEQHESDDDDDEDESSSSSSSSDEDEFVYVKLAEIRKDVQCPICLGIIRKTRKVMECLHRFCRECIDKSMRLGNNECPACRTHCASRRSLRDDPNYDALIALLYPDIDKYEEEELAFDGNDKARNKKIQASIEQTSRRQTEALGKKRASAKATANAFIKRSQGNTRNLRGRKRKRSAEPQGSDNELDNDNDNGDKYSSSSDEAEPEPEPTTEVRPKRYKRWSGGPSSLPSSSGANGVCDDNELEGSRRTAGSTEILAWGRGGIRSNTRHGGQIGSSGKSSRNSQLSKLINHLQKLPRNDDELDIHFRLGSMNEEVLPNLQKSYVCCKPTMSVTNVRQHVARGSGLPVEDIELFLVIWGCCLSEMTLLEDHQILSDIAKMSNSNDLKINFREKKVKSLWAEWYDK